jgi:hypothetical protein
MPWTPGCFVVAKAPIGTNLLGIGGNDLSKGPLSCHGALSWAKALCKEAQHQLDCIAMSRQRLHRLGTAFLMVLSLLFSQLALAAYVCPGQGNVQAMAEMIAAGQPCDRMDARQPGLCHQHAADPGKTSEVVKLPVVSLPAVIQVLELPLALEVEASSGAISAAPLDSRPPPDPLFLSTLRLRV